MRFVASSTALLGHLQSISRVINSKSTLPILDNFLFKLQDNELEITASDLETTMTTQLQLDNADGEGRMAVPAKMLLDTLKEFPEQPLTFEIQHKNDSRVIEIFSDNGKFTIPGYDPDEYPQWPQLKPEQNTRIEMPAEVLLKGINSSLFATAVDELRPVMNGIFVQIKPQSLAFVASDAHKLVRYRRSDIQPGFENSFILPKKPANLLKGILAKQPGTVRVEFDDKNAVFTLVGYKLICRLTEGQYPNYENVIPHQNPNKLVVDRAELLTALRRVSVFSNPSSNLVKLEIKDNMVVVSAQDIDFSTSAYENINAQYDGESMHIGFKSLFLLEILSNLSSNEVSIELSDPIRASLIFPMEKDSSHEDYLTLLMPMMINT